MKKSMVVVVVLLVVLSVGFVLASKMYRITWNANTEGDLAGYRTYIRAAGGTYDYNDPMWEGPEVMSEPFDTSSWADGTFYFVVRAFDTSGNESGDSNECSIPVDNTAPAPPTGCASEEAG